MLDASLYLLYAYRPVFSPYILIRTVVICNVN